MISPEEPARCILLLASGQCDEYNGQFLDIRDKLYPKQSLQSLKSLLKDYLEFKEQEIWNEEAQNRLGV